MGRGLQKDCKQTVKYSVLVRPEAEEDLKEAFSWYPNIGKAMADDLLLIGIDHPKKLIGKEPFELYGALCTTSGKRHDPCVIDVFMSVIHFMEGGDPLPWWSFTDKRKNILRKNQMRTKKGER